MTEQKTDTTTETEEAEKSDGDGAIVRRTERWTEWNDAVAVYTEYRGRFVFELVHEADDLADNAVVYVGDAASKWYPTEHELDDVPQVVLDTVEEMGYGIIEGIDAGWTTWEGRPEWSEWDVSAEDAEVVRDASE